jgi:hypothetical protein
METNATFQPASVNIRIKDMDMLSKTGIWISRVVIVFVSILFTIIGLRNIFFPAQNAALAGITLTSGQAMSVARATMGSMPFGFAIITGATLFFPNSLFRGVFSVFVVLFVLTAVRIIGYTVDGAAPFVAPEIVVTLLSGAGLFLEIRRRRKYTGGL